MRLMLPQALACAALVCAGAANAQDTPSKKPVASAKPTVHPVIAAAAPNLSAADPEQLIAAAQTLYGPYDCEFRQTLSISKHAIDGYVVVTFSSKAYTMKPVRSSTGAVRLEEVGNGPMLMVQIPTKSMLMDTVRGRRIVDACVHETQAKESAPDANSLGMNMPGQVNTTDLTMTQTPTIKR